MTIERIASALCITGAVIASLVLAAMAAVGDHSAWGIVVTPCAWCGATEDIEVHHIVPQHVAPERARDTNNMICLCRRDHLALGHRGDFKNAVTNLLRMIEEGKR